MLTAALLALLFYCVLSLWLCWHDIRTGLLPDRLTCPLLWGGLAYNLCLQPPQLSSAVLGAIAGYGGLALIYWLYRWIRKREGVGYGDVKFLAALGAWHGWEALPQLMALACGLALSFVAGQIILGHLSGALKNPLPFGPFLAAAGLITGWQEWSTLLP